MTFDTDARSGNTRVGLEQLNHHGIDLNRPECVLCTSDGSLYTADWRGGVCRIGPDGTETLILARNPPVEILPNGIAILKDGSFLLANIGDAGGVWQLFQDGRVEPFLTEVNGRRLPSCNFVMVDALGRVWITVSTSLQPRARAYRKDVADGYIVMVDGQGAKVVAENLGYTNEAQFDPRMEWLYVNETFARCLTRFRVSDKGQLFDREIVVRFGKGTFPDGLAFDEQGGVWVVSIISNRVFRIYPDQSVDVILEDSNTEHLDWIELAYENNAMNRPHLDKIVSSQLRNISSIAFGGARRQTAFLGCLLGQQVVSFETPYVGAKPVHWDWNLTE